MLQGEFEEKLYNLSGFDKCELLRLLRLFDGLDVSALEELFFSEVPYKILGKSTLFFPDSFFPESFFSSAKQLFAKQNIAFEEGFLALYIRFARRTLELYNKLKLPEAVLFDTLKALSVNADECKKSTGIYGLSDYIWLANHVRGNIIRLGSFEYQNGIFSYDEDVKLQNKTIRNGDRAIFMHVPAGASLDKKSRNHSYEMAFEFFGHGVLICDSWLLFSRHRELSKNSNIHSFMDDFEIFHTDETYDYEGLYRVFGRQTDYRDTNKLSCDTSLQRMYKELITKGLPVGSAVGARLI